MSDPEAGMDSGQEGREEGFTLIEVLVVILVIGVLAAIALPSFVGQSDKARDVAAKSAARNLVTKVEVCFTETMSFPLCGSGDPGLDDGGITEATAAGVVDGYLVVATSGTGNTFTIERHAGAVTRTCTDTGSSHGGCAGGSW